MRYRKRNDRANRRQEPRQAAPPLARFPGRPALSLPEYVYAKANATSTTIALAPGGSCTAYRASWSGSAWSKDTGREITLYDPHKWASALEDETLLAFMHPVSNRWEVFGPHGQTLLRMAKADGAITAGSSGTCSIYEDDATDSGVNVTVYNDWADDGVDISSGDELYIRYAPGDGQWHFAGGDCP
jgi:hypothetical protein